VCAPFLLRPHGFCTLLAPRLRPSSLIGLEEYVSSVRDVGSSRPGPPAGPLSVSLCFRKWPFSSARRRLVLLILILSVRFSPLSTPLTSLPRQWPVEVSYEGDPGTPFFLDFCLCRARPLADPFFFRTSPKDNFAETGLTPSPFSAFFFGSPLFQFFISSDSKRGQFPPCSSIRLDFCVGLPVTSSRPFRRSVVDCPLQPFLGALSLFTRFLYGFPSSVARGKGV